METIDALLGRNSASRLCEPAPAGAARERIFRAALRAPDHGWLRPWRFLVVEGAARTRLGMALAEAMRRDKPTVTEAELDKLRAAPLRAPLLLVLLVSVQEHPKVPEIEQILSVGCAAQNMLVAAHALGFAGIWRTGPVTYSEALHQQLSLAPAERVIGFLYLGSPDGPAKALPELEPEDYFRDWSG